VEFGKKEGLPTHKYPWFGSTSPPLKRQGLSICKTEIDHHRKIRKIQRHSGPGIWKKGALMGNTSTRRPNRVWVGTTLQKKKEAPDRPQDPIKKEGKVFVRNQEPVATGMGKSTTRNKRKSL